MAAIDISTGLQADCDHEAANQDFTRASTEPIRTDSVVSQPKPYARHEESDSSTSDDEAGIEAVRIKFAPKVERVPTHEQSLKCTEEKEYDNEKYDSSRTTMGEGNLNWKLKVYKRCSNDDVDVLSVDILCDNSSRLWEADARVELRLINSSRHKNVMFSQDHVFNWANKNVEHKLGAWNELISPENGFVGTNGELNIDAKISFRSLTGVRLPAKHDFTSPSRLTDVILVVEEIQVHANKAILAVASPVFKTLFFDESEDSEAIRIENVNYKDFIRFLSHIYTPNSVITVGNVDSLLALSHRFKTESVTEKADAFLAYSEDFSVEKKLWLADKYDLLNVKNDCIYELDTTDKIKQIWRSDDYGKVSDAMKVELLERVMMK